MLDAGGLTSPDLAYETAAFLHPTIRGVCMCVYVHAPVYVYVPVSAVKVSGIKTAWNKVMIPISPPFMDKINEASLMQTGSEPD